MPMSPFKNALYRAGLVLFAPSTATQQIMTRTRGDEVLALSPDYGPGRVFKRNHMLGGTVVLGEDDTQTVFCVSLKTSPKRTAQVDTLYRVASVTKTATALCILRLVQQGLFSLSDRLFELLPCELPADHPLRTATVEMVLSHRSGLRDVPAYEAAFRAHEPYDVVLADPDVMLCPPDTQFKYCNFAYGLLGSLIEQLTGESLAVVFEREVFAPLGMEAYMDVTQVPSDRAMPISRVLPYIKSRDFTAAGAAAHAQPLTTASPKTHFAYTAGSMFATAPAIDRMLHMIACGGTLDGTEFLPADVIADMTRRHASYGADAPNMDYGLGLILLRDPALCDGLIIGHQGFAYGCVDGAFYEEATGRRIVQLNGGASEYRSGRLGKLNRDLLKWALQKENPAWL